MSIERARSLRKRMPAAEAKMWNGLRTLKPLGFHFRRQVPLGKYYADFACHHPKLVIELDGDTHYAGGAPEYDALRDSFIRNERYRVLRFPNDEVMHNLDGVLTAVRLGIGASERLATPTLDPSPQGGGRRRSRKIVELGHRSPKDIPPPVGEESSGNETT